VRLVEVREGVVGVALGGEQLAADPGAGLRVLAHGVPDSGDGVVRGLGGGEQRRERGHGVALGVGLGARLGLGEGSAAQTIPGRGPLSVATVPGVGE